MMETTGTFARPQVLLPGEQSHRSSASIPLACGFSVLCVAILFFGGQGGILRAAIPALGVFVAVLLYFNRPIVFIQYSLWVWFLIPLVRRIVDWRFGFVEPNYILLTPFLVSAVAGLAYLPPRRAVDLTPPLPFVLCGGSILYGFVVGMAQDRSIEMIFGLVNWLGPMLLGLFLYANWPRYELHKAAVMRTFLWAALLLGLYGVYQYFFPPAWDTYWLESVMKENPTFGRPEPLQIRVWSTVNSPGPFANVMLIALLLLMISRSALKLPASIVGYLSFLLSVVRTAWLSWVVGFIFMLRSLSPRVILRVVLSLALLLVCLVPLASDPRMSDVIGDRFKTFTDLGHDDSYGARTQLYQVMIQDALAHPFGYGLRAMDSHGKIDSGILALVFSLGWIGAAAFAIGILLLFTGGNAGAAKDDQFAATSKAIVVALLAQLVSGTVFVNVTAALFWIFASLYLSASRIHRSPESLPASPR